MQIKLFVCLIILFGVQETNGQDEQSHTLIETNHISKIEAFIFLSPENKPGIDSNLITTEYFNALGYRTKIEIHDSTGIVNSYEYIYQNDTIRLERNTYFKGILKSKTKLFYTNNGDEIKSIDYDPAGLETGTFSKTLYNKHYQIKQQRFYIANKLFLRKKYINRADGKPERIREYFTGKSKQKYITDQMESRTETTYPNGKMMVVRKIIFRHPATILGLSGKLLFNEGDEWERRILCKESGLLDEEEQNKNGIFLARKKYKYFP